MKRSKKISDTSIRVLETLKVLTKESSSIQDIINYFEITDPNNRVYTNEVILKYINTLKVFGFRFSKVKGKYSLLNSPNQFEFSDKELKVVYLIEYLSKIFPEGKIHAEINEFLQELEKNFSNNTRLRAHNFVKPKIFDIEFDYSKYSKQIEEYERYCIDRQRIKVTYRKQNNTEISVMVEPNEIKYQGHEVYLGVYNQLSAQLQDINLKSIVKVEQLPLKSNSTRMLSSIIFMLKDRLAKSYRLHDGEKLLEIKSDGSILILNQLEDRTLLLRRLMRYGANCEVVSPKTAREDMKEMIQSTLKNYI